jgi:hypothetical protein
VDPVPNHYFSENLVVPGIEPGISGCVARNSGCQTTDRGGLLVSETVRSVRSRTFSGFVLFSVLAAYVMFYVSSYMVTCPEPVFGDTEHVLMGKETSFDESRRLLQEAD